MVPGHDPALAYIELQNEDDIFFYTTENVLAQCPTYRKDLMRRFADWLQAQYGTQAQLAKVGISSATPTYLPVPVAPMGLGDAPPRPPLKPGSVIAQTPAGGSRVEQSTQVKLTVAE